MSPESKVEKLAERLGREILVEVDDGAKWTYPDQRDALAAAVVRPLAEALVKAEEAMTKADELLAGMWSHYEEGRANLGHTWPVQASEVLRAALKQIQELS